MPLFLKTMEVQIKGDQWNTRFRTVQVYWSGSGGFETGFCSKAVAGKTVVFCDVLLFNKVQWAIHIIHGRWSLAFERHGWEVYVEKLLRLSQVMVVAHIHPSILSVNLACLYANLGLYNGLNWFLSTTANWKNLDDITRLKLFQVFSSFIELFWKIAHMSVDWAYVSLWLCMFRCFLQGPIRLKYYELMHKNQLDFASKH